MTRMLAPSFPAGPAGHIGSRLRARNARRRHASSWCSSSRTSTPISAATRWTPSAPRRDLQLHLERLARQHLADGRSLKLELLDIDRVGALQAAWPLGQPGAGGEVTGRLARDPVALRVAPRRTDPGARRGGACRDAVRAAPGLGRRRRCAGGGKDHAGSLVRAARGHTLAGLSRACPDRSEKADRPRAAEVAQVGQHAVQLRRVGAEPGQQRRRVLVHRQRGDPAAVSLPALHPHVVRPAQHQLGGSGRRRCGPSPRRPAPGGGCPRHGRCPRFGWARRCGRNRFA